MIGGLDGRWEPVDNVWAYDPGETLGRPRPTCQRPGALAAAVLGSKIYAIGGRDAGQGLGSTEVYDPAADAWQTADDLPTPRDHLAAAVIGNRIYATGGRLTSYARNMPVTEEYDPILDELSRRAPLHNQKRYRRRHRPGKVVRIWRGSHGRDF